MSRAQTLTLALLTLHLVLGLLCLAVARGERQSAALRLWGWALLAFAIGASLTLMTFLPLDLRQVAGNTIISLSGAYSASALLRHTRFRIPVPWFAAGVIACGAALALNHAMGYGLAVDIAIPTLWATGLFLVAIIQLLRAPVTATRPAVLFLVGTLVITVLVWTLRAIAIFEALGGTWDRDRADLVIALFAIGQLVTLVGATLGLVWIEVRNMGWELERMALSDVLTGLPNRRAMLARFAEEVSRAKRSEGRFAIALFDADHFKQINDTHGHLAGDAALAEISNALATTVRGADGLGRIGGEEFLVILSGLDRAHAVDAADRIRRAVSQLRPAPGGTPMTLTLSGGMAFYPDEGTTWDQLYSIADRRLYRAKDAGRDRVISRD